MADKTNSELISEIDSKFKSIRLVTLIMPVMGIGYFFIPGLSLFSSLVFFAATVIGRELCLNRRKLFIIDDYLTEACKLDNTTIIEHLSTKFPDIDLKQFHNSLYTALRHKSWRVATWFFDHGIVTHSQDIEDETTRILSKDDATEAIKNIRTIALYTRLDAETAPLEQEEEEDTPILKI